ncbi:MAG: serine--tRNA ligase [Eubacteriales bacterium]|nr:serine--tRNA ligase [Eubacteriales bacterium]
MLDVKRIRQNPEELVEAMKNRRNKGADVTAFLEDDAKRRALLVEAEALKARRNTVSAEIPNMKKRGEDPSALMAEMKEAGAKIKELDAAVAELDAKLDEFLMKIPNIPHSSVPIGADDTENEEIRRWGEPTKFDFEPKAHWDLGADLDILDAATAAKVTGARFTFYRGLGARLERSIVNFYLDTHTCESGYTEIFPPYMVNRASMTGTGQLPKFEEDAFRVADTDYFLIPTAEVPVTNMFRDQILEGENLPYKFCAYSACFRAEAGSAGRDTRGLIRQHQFNKVELVKFANPDNSYEELESLTNDAEKVLQKLGLPYRVVCLSTGDLGFSSAKTYDIEVWMPSYNRYVEISSCSNFEDFQARRAGIRFRREKGAKPELVHTLNGSGVAIGRTVAAILENCQQADGSIKIPKVLVPYMGANVITRKS